MEIPLNAQVECTDGIYGRSLYRLIDPVLDQVTSFVVKQEVSPNTEYLVLVDSILETIIDTIRLPCSMAELSKMIPFAKTEFVEEQTLNYAEYQGGMGLMGVYYYIPYISSEITVQRPVQHLQIPPGEQAIATQKLKLNLRITEGSPQRERIWS